MSSNPEADNIACGLNTVGDISQKGGLDGVGITVQFPDCPGTALIMWAYLLHDNYTAPMQLWTGMEYNMDFFMVLRSKGNGLSMTNLFLKLLLEVEGGLFQTSSLCHAFMHCNERRDILLQNSLMSRVQSLELHESVMLEGVLFNAVMQHVNNTFSAALVAPYTKAGPPYICL